MPLSVLDDKVVTRVLASVIAVGFLAWSGAVWRATASVDTLATSVNLRLTALEDDHRTLHDDLAKHASLPTHNGTAVTLTKLETEMEAVRRDRGSDLVPIQRQLELMQRQLDRIETRAEALANARARQ